MLPRHRIVSLRSVNPFPNVIITFFDEFRNVSLTQEIETPESFLAHLPASVIKDGKIIDIREDIAQLLGVRVLIQLSTFCTHKKKVRLQKRR
jgi:hypothetical protein